MEPITIFVVVVSRYSYHLYIKDILGSFLKKSFYVSILNNLLFGIPIQRFLLDLLQAYYFFSNTYIHFLK